MDLIVIGRIVKPHGMDGTLKVFPLTDFPQHFESLKHLYIVKEDSFRTLLRGVKFSKGFVLLKIEDCLDRTSAEGLVGAMVAIEPDELWPLNEDEYYQFQIIGLQVVTDDGICLGEIVDIIITGSNDVYVVRSGPKEYLIPAIKDVIKKVDLEKGVVTIHLMEGLIDDL